jgi:hypothetical protein
MPGRFASVATGRRAALATILTLVACATVQRTSITDEPMRR